MVGRALRTFAVATWLGWQIQSNWTDPLLFFIYSVARPLGGTLILVFMFFVVAGGRRGEMLDFFVVGAAFWPLVVFAMQGVAWALLEDREHFKTIRYVYTSPIPFWAYLVGRGFALAAVGTSATLITIAVGILVLHVPFVLPLDRIPYLLAAFVLGIAGLLAVGMILAGAIFLVSGEAWRLPDAVGQALYLVCGAVFPITVLPDWLEPLARIIPITYWLEAMRRGLLPPGGVRSLPGMGDGAVLAALALLTAAAAVVAAVVYAAGLTRARQKGILDAATGY
ncbi:MAG TPA: ABC transporter permease [bacterium]|nr:ABC transporter permease [bacterium]